MKLIVIFAVLVQGSLAMAVTPGEPRASTCKACHGEGGISANDQWPNLKNQKKSYLVEQLKAFRSGERNNPLMTPVAKMLSDADINDLAEYYAAGAP